MSYIQGFLIPVPEDKKEAYRKMATDVVPMFEDYGAKRIVECWGEDVPHGETTDMYGGVDAKEGEAIIFSWIDWGTKETCDAAAEKMENDERMAEPPEDMPFDGMRMVYAGFELIGEAGAGGETGYVQGYVAPVPRADKGAFADMCATIREVAIDSGALRAVDSYAAEIEDGKVTDFKRAVAAKDDEGVAFGFVEWPSKQAFEEGMAKMQADDRMPGPGADMPIDGKRLIFGGFDVLLDTGRK